MDPLNSLLPVDSQNVFRRSLADFIRLQDSSPSLRESDVLYLDRYKQRRGFLHRSLLLRIRTPESRDCYLLMERLSPLNTSLVKRLFKPLPARDEVMVACHSTLLLSHDGCTPESSFKFRAGALKMHRLARLLWIVHEELPVYRIYPDNCWYFCSVIEESLLPFGEYIRGGIRNTSLNPESRARVKGRFQAFLSREQYTDPLELVTDPASAALDDKSVDIATVTTNIETLETLWPSIQSNTLKDGYVLLQDIIPDTVQMQTVTGEQLSLEEYNEESKPGDSLEILCAIVNRLSLIDVDPSSRAKLVSHTGDDAQTIMHCLQTILDAQSQIDLHPRRPVVIRMLQDICKATSSLPTSYYIRGITLTRCLRRGGEASTCHGTLRENSGFREIVLRKVFLDDVRSSASEKLTLQCIRREIITHRQLDHQNIIPLLGVYQADDHPLVIITPWYRNGDAFEYLEKNRTSSVYLQIVVCISVALGYLHSRDPPVIHGDLHGRNVLIDDDGNARLCDFGLTRLKYETTPKSIADIPQGGSLRYLAPELAFGPSKFRTSQATDIYSFSMTMLQLGTLSEPFHEKYTRALAAVGAAQREERPEMPPSLAGLADTATRALWCIMESMWAHNPAERISATNASARLHELIVSLIKTDTKQYQSRFWTRFCKICSS